MTQTEKVTHCRYPYPMRFTRPDSRFRYARSKNPYFSQCISKNQRIDDLPGVKPRPLAHRIMRGVPIRGTRLYGDQRKAG